MTQESKSGRKQEVALPGTFRVDPFGGPAYRHVGGSNRTVVWEQGMPEGSNEVGNRVLAGCDGCEHREAEEERGRGAGTAELEKEVQRVG